MIAFMHENWPGLVVVLLIGLLVTWWLLGRSGARRRERYHAPDALDEGAAPVARNQAFINAPSAAAAVTAPLAATGPDILGGIGEIAAWGAAREVDDIGQLDAGPILMAAPEIRSDHPPLGTDDLTRIKGVGAKLSARLGELGVTSFAQIAAWDDADLVRIDGMLGAFAGRPLRDDWVAQCRYLAAGDVAGYETHFGKL